ncbi:MAG: ATP-grasp fold amidoligase family protein, partial [Prevotellaceae bacterium]|nr:ATP-grasp fold amidoligase family protein [Prevotellaceae bacterium]
MNIKSIIGDFVFQCLSRTSPKLYIEVLYKRYFHKSIDWKHPRNVDEKINWLKLYSDTSKWTELADKYKVREYVAQQGFGDMLVKLYGKWDKADNIEWEKLPERFVMKANNGSGDILICQDKSKIDTKFHVKKFNSVLKMKFGYLKVEPHYNKIPPCIIAE